jgi:hypothetical protein
VRGRTALLILTVAAAIAITPAGASANPTASISGGGFTVTKKPTTATTLGIGWFYTDSPDFPQTKANPLKISWPACAKAGGVKLYFPLHQHIYEGDNGDFSTTKPTIAYLTGPPLNPKDPFNANVYVGDLATPGKRSLQLNCMHLQHGHLVSIMTGGLKTNFVHKDVNFSPPGSFTSNDQMDFFGTAPQTEVVINRSCSEPGTPSVTVSSPALSAGPSGGSYVSLPFEDILGTFKGTVTPAPGAGPGSYEAVVSCGSGRVGVGTIKIN